MHDSSVATETGLRCARAAFTDHAETIYAGGADKAGRDSDRLELIADRLIDALEAMEAAFDRLDVARDIALYRGPMLTRNRAPFDLGTLARGCAQAIAEEILSGPAGAVLLAAVSRRVGVAPHQAIAEPSQA